MTTSFIALFLYYEKQIDSMLLCGCFVIHILVTDDVRMW